jgi:hypothetical protein
VFVASAVNHLGFRLVSPTSGVISEAWALYKRHWSHLLGISLATYLLVAFASAVLTILLTWLGFLIGVVITIVALFWLQGALVKAVEDIRDGRADLSLGETFAAAKPHLSSVIVAGFLAGLGIAVGILLLIVPGLFLLTIWCLIVPVIVLEGRSAGESFSRSRELVRGYGWNVFGVLVLTFLLWVAFQIVLKVILSPLADWLQGFVTSIVAGTLAAPFLALILTLLYFRLRAAKEPAQEHVAVTPPPTPTDPGEPPPAPAG